MLFKNSAQSSGNVRAGTASGATVSYTHLDVYKSQIMRFSVRFIVSLHTSAQRSDLLVR